MSWFKTGWFVRIGLFDFMPIILISRRCRKLTQIYRISDYQRYLREINLVCRQVGVFLLREIPETDQNEKAAPTMALKPCTS